MAATETASEIRQQREALCPVCNGLEMISVMPVDRESTRDFGKLAAKGYTVRTVPLSRCVTWCKCAVPPCRAKGKHKPADAAPDLFA